MRKREGKKRGRIKANLLIIFHISTKIDGSMPELYSYYAYGHEIERAIQKKIIKQSSFPIADSSEIESYTTADFNTIINKLSK